GGPLRLAIRAGTILAINEGFLRHDGDTQGGSAGAPLLDEEFRVIGLHHASRYVEGVSGGRLVNEAIRATAIRSSLAANQELVAVFPGRPSATSVRVTVVTEPKPVSKVVSGGTIRSAASHPGAPSRNGLPVSPGPASAASTATRSLGAATPELVEAG